MDYTSIVIAILTTLITVLTPVIVAAAAVYGRKAVAAVETSKYAEAYAKLDPIVKAAIDTAADEAMMRVRNDALPFGREHVLPLISRRAVEAANALGTAAGVRIDLQRDHFDDLIAVAVREVHAALDDMGADEAIERHIDPAGEAFGPAAAFPAPNVVSRPYDPAGLGDMRLDVDTDDVDARFEAYDGPSGALRFGDAVIVRNDGTNYDPGVPGDYSGRTMYGKYSEVD